MVAANPEAVTIPARHQNGQLVIRKLQAGSDCQSAPVQGVHAVSIHVPREVGGTTDATDSDYVVSRYPQLDQAFLHSSDHAKNAASATPIGIDFDVLAAVQQALMQLRIQT